MEEKEPSNPFSEMLASASTGVSSFDSLQTYSTTSNNNNNNNLFQNSSILAADKRALGGVPRSPLGAPGCTHSLSVLPDASNNFLIELDLRQSLPDISLQDIAPMLSPLMSTNRDSDLEKPAKKKYLNLHKNKNKNDVTHHFQDREQQSTAASTNSNQKFVQKLNRHPENTISMKEIVSTRQKLLTPEPVDHLEECFHLDLTEIAQQQECGSDVETGRIPEKLKMMITHPKESLVYLALCGGNITGYQQSVVDSTLEDMEFYLNACIERGYITESAYIEEIITDIKRENEELKKLEGPLIGEAEDQLDDAINDLAKKEAKWEQLVANLDAEEAIVLKNIELRHKCDVENLDEEWSSETKLKMFNKPSPKLIDLRNVTRRMLHAHRFDESTQMAKIVAKIEREEEANASMRMRESYRLARNALDQSYEKEIRIAKLEFQKKKFAIQKKRTVSLMSLDNKVSKIEKTVNSRLESSKSREKSVKKNQQKIKSSNKTVINKNALVNNSNKLKLPPIKPMNRSPLPNTRPSTSMSRSENQSRCQSSAKKRFKLSRPSSRMAVRSPNSPSSFY